MISDSNNLDNAIEKSIKELSEITFNKVREFTYEEIKNRIEGYINFSSYYLKKSFESLKRDTLERMHLLRQCYLDSRKIVEYVLGHIIRKKLNYPRTLENLLESIPDPIASREIRNSAELAVKLLFRLLPDEAKRIYSSTSLSQVAEGVKETIEKEKGFIATLLATNGITDEDEINKVKENIFKNLIELYASLVLTYANSLIKYEPELSHYIIADGKVAETLHELFLKIFENALSEVLKSNSGEPSGKKEEKISIEAKNQ